MLWVPVIQIRVIVIGDIGAALPSEHKRRHHLATFGAI
jgi:hypothetical protein